MSLPVVYQTVLLLMSLSVAPPPVERGITATEKKAFFESLATLETRGCLFTDESVEKALPYTRVLLSLTTKDLEKYDHYGFLALNPFGRNAFTKQEPSRVIVKPGESFQLRYGVLVHGSDKESDYDAAAAYRRFNLKAG